jgi:hypothetical protein
MLSEQLEQHLPEINKGGMAEALVWRVGETVRQ